MSKKLTTRLATALLSLFLAVLSGCQPGERASESRPDGKLRIVATTGMIGDAASRIAGEHAVVEALMGPGVDPHLYKASESDVRRLSEADLIFYQGLHLEGRMVDILGKIGRTRPVLAVGETLPETELLGFSPVGMPVGTYGAFDPHLWFDVELWSRLLDPIAEKLAELQPEFAAEFRANADAYEEELLQLDAWVKQRFDELPEDRRVLVTAHDAFSYLGRRYGIEVIGIQGISTVAEAGLKDLDRVVDIVVERKIPAVFIESSVSPRSIEALQRACQNRGHDVAIGGQLYSDAMGAADSDAGTYPGMVRANINTIVDALLQDVDSASGDGPS
jgi:manganese/zinc/iron transport system substrate-binding protein